MFLQSAAVLPADPPGIFARATADEPLEHLTFLLPGVTYLAWQPLIVPDKPYRPSNGFGLELSLARWISGGTYLGAVGHFEHLDRNRVGFGIEGGYQLIGLEVGVARDFAAKDDRAAQWSLQIGPYASVGMLYVSPRYVVALHKQNKLESPGDGGMLVIGLKLPIKVGGR
jgi:hypothetical protein